MKDEEKKILSPADATTAPDYNPDSDIPPDADAEERFNDFWKRHGTLIFGGLGVVALGVLGWQVSLLFGQKAEEGLRAEFALATTPDAKLVFAQENADHTLGGLAYLETADAEYADGDYLQAAAHYEAAIDALGDSPVAARARLGFGIAQLRNNNEAGLTTLERLAQDNSELVLGIIRGEAAYHLAVALWERDELDQLRQTLELLETLEDAPEWQAAGRRLGAQIPALKTSPEVAP